jgi:hypothetical protein
MGLHKGLPYAAVGWNSSAGGEFHRPVIWMRGVSGSGSTTSGNLSGSF